MCVFVCVCECPCVHVCMYVLSVHVCMCVCMCVWLLMCTCVCAYVCACVLLFIKPHFTAHCRFYLPHGLTVDNEGNIWITDVAMHQVFKFHPSNLSKPILTLGVPFQPGHDHTHFCKPSAVAVAADGSSFFVADG